VKKKGEKGLSCIAEIWGKAILGRGGGKKENA